MCILSYGPYVYSGWRPLTLCRPNLMRAGRVKGENMFTHFSGKRSHGIQIWPIIYLATNQSNDLTHTNDSKYTKKWPSSLCSISECADGSALVGFFLGRFFCGIEVCGFSTLYIRCVNMKVATKMTVWDVGIAVSWEWLVCRWRASAPLPPDGPHPSPSLLQPHPPTPPNSSVRISFASKQKLFGCIMINFNN